MSLPRTRIRKATIALLRYAPILAIGGAAWSEEQPRHEPVLHATQEWPAASMQEKQARGSQGDSHLAVSPVSFFLRDGNDRRYPLSGLGIQSAGSDMDVVWGFSRWHGYGTRVVCLMHQPGKLQPIFETDNKHDFCNACFDGKYVWLPIRGRDSRVLIIDPRDGEIITLTRHQGLPRLWKPPYIVAIESGRVLLAGNFREPEGDSACLMEIDARDRSSLKVRYLRPSLSRNGLRGHVGPKSPGRPSVFSPHAILPLREPEGTVRKIILGCSAPGNLLLDLETCQGTIFASRVPSSVGNGDLVEFQGALYWTARKQLWRLGAGDLEESTSIASLPEKGRIAFDKTGRIYLFGKQIWTAANVFARFELVDSDMEIRGKAFLHRLLRSAHYGLLLHTSDGSRWRTYQISLEPALDKP